MAPFAPAVQTGDPRPFERLQSKMMCTAEVVCYKAVIVPSSQIQWELHDQFNKCGAQPRQDIMQPQWVVNGPPTAMHVPGIHAALVAASQCAKSFTNGIGALVQVMRIPLILACRCKVLSAVLVDEVK